YFYICDTLTLTFLCVSKMSRKINLNVILKRKGENEMESAFNEKETVWVMKPNKDLHMPIFNSGVREVS
ncbi:hypothetical protein ABWK46_02285, partial [Peribacillus frigoritolerans]|uniref:hypothetical protein n=1 Tax=Peribacillus frigoritolerans TaxID=450367 RepID=UPI003391D703